MLKGGKREPSLKEIQTEGGSQGPTAAAADSTQPPPELRPFTWSLGLLPLPVCQAGGGSETTEPDSHTTRSPEEANPQLAPLNTSAVWV